MRTSGTVMGCAVEVGIVGPPAHQNIRERVADELADAQLAL